MAKIRERLAEQQKLREKHDSNLTWAVYALISGLFMGVGNFFMGLKLSMVGIFGPGFSGPLSLILLLSYRLYQALSNKFRDGKFVNKRNSNWYSLDTGKFKYENLKPLVGNFLPNLLGLIFLSLGMKYATMGGVN